MNIYITNLCSQYQYTQEWRRRLHRITNPGRTKNSADRSQLSSLGRINITVLLYFTEQDLQSLIWAPCHQGVPCCSNTRAGPYGPFINIGQPPDVVDAIRLLITSHPHWASASLYRGVRITLIAYCSVRLKPNNTDEVSFVCLRNGQH